MNYREQQLRLILKQHQNKWEKERDILQHDIWTLENSTDLKLLNQAQDKQKELQEALDNLISLLGKSDIKNLTDLRNLLKGKTLKELITNWENKYKLLGEEKDEEIEAQIIKQTELEALRKEREKELKKEIDTQQKELIARTREIWDLEKKQEQTFKELREREEQLNNTNQQLKEQKGVNTLYNQKINDLDNQLINLAKQKIKNQKEAQTLLTQLENNWKKEKESWQQEKTNLITNHQQAQSLAQERKEFYGQIESLQQANQKLTTNLTEKGKVITEHLSNIKDLEKEIRQFKQDEWILNQKYPLEKFKAWILADKSKIVKERNPGIEKRPFFIGYEQTKITPVWDKVIRKQEGNTLRQEVVSEWMEEVDKEEESKRERERAK